MPPILVTQCAWSQNDLEIHIRLPLKNVQPSKMNVITTENFLKVNFAPYLFQLVLNGKVEPTKTKCISKDYELVVELTKATPEMWDSLSQQVNRKDLVEMRKCIISREHEKVAQRSQIKSKEMQEHKRMVNTHQINFHNEEKSRIQSLKNQVRSRGFQELTALQVTDGKDLGHFYPTTGQVTQITNEACKLTDTELPVPIPLPRTKGAIQFCLSRRVLPSPKRASTKVEEEEWLKKEAEAMRASGFVPDDLTDEERNPIWLLDKGMSLFKNDNYLGAINAFSYGSRIAPKMPIFYLRLAQTQLKLHHYYRSIENCNKALELLVPIVEKNKSMRAETFRTRGAAYGYLNEIDLSSSDYRSAEMLD